DDVAESAEAEAAGGLISVDDDVERATAATQRDVAGAGGERRVQGDAAADVDRAAAAGGSVNRLIDGEQTAGIDGDVAAGMARVAGGDPAGATHGADGDSIRVGVLDTPEDRGRETVDR